MQNNNTGTLYLIPVLLGNTAVTEVLPEKTIAITSLLSCFIAENAKSSRQFLKMLPHKSAMKDIEIFEIDKHTSKIDFDYFFSKLRSGIDTGLLSEAGMPCLADPGSDFVRQAHKEAIRIVPLTGPSSVFLALAASGMNGQGFTFHGYLPKEKTALTEKIKVIEGNARRLHHTQIFIETPYRNQSLFNELLATCNANTLLCLASEITTDSEQIHTFSISDWKKRKPEIHKKPTVFLLF